MRDDTFDVTVYQLIHGLSDEVINDFLRLAKTNYRLQKRVRGLRTANRQQAKHIARLHELIGDALKRPSKATP